MRATLEDLERTFLERFAQVDNEDPDRLKLAIESVRNHVLAGSWRARVRDRGLDRRRRVISPAARALAASDAVVIARVARVDGLNAETILSSDRSRVVSRSRDRAAWILMRVRKRSSWQVATILRRRDHKTILRGANVVDREIAGNPALGRKLRRLAA